MGRQAVVRSVEPRVAAPFHQQARQRRGRARDGADSRLLPKREKPQGLEKRKTDVQHIFK